MSRRAALLRLLLFALFSLTQAKPVLAQMSTDGTLGVAQTLIGPDYLVTASLGQQVGNNLFHSFEDFIVNAGESVSFSGSASIQNIIVRVTGGEMAVIDGLFRSTIPGANIYVLNSDGFSIGPNTTQDISGDFYLSTVSGLVFSDDIVFLTRAQVSEVLTSAAPEAVISDGASSPIIVTGALLFFPGNVGLIADGIGLSSAIVDTSIAGANLLLASVNSAGELSLSGEIRTGFPTFQDMGLGGTAVISAGAGDINIIARDFNTPNGTSVVTTGSGTVSLTASGDINLGGSLATSTTLGTVNTRITGNFTVSTGSLTAGTIDSITTGNLIVGASAMLDVSTGSIAAAGFDVDAGAMFKLGINSSMDFAQLRVAGAANPTVDFNGTIEINPPASVPTGTLFELISNDGAGVINGTPVIQTPAGRFATTIDNDLVVQVLGTPGVSLSPTAGNQVSESGTTTTINLVLDGVPRGEVALNLTLDNSEAEIVSAATTIQPEDWDTPQPIEIRGLSDGFTDGDQVWNLEATITTATDVDFNGLMDSVAVTTLDGDHVPDAFNIIDQLGASLNILTTSGPITFSGFDASTTISVTGGLYAIDGGAFTTANGLVNPGQTVAVQQTSSANFSTTTDTVLTVGGVVDTFSVTTFDEDSTPDAFNFSDQTDVGLNTLATSDTITVNGINTTTAISVMGGEYSIDGGPFTSGADTVSEGQSVTLRQTSSGDFATLSETVLNIGGVSGRFSVTTRAANQTPDVFSFTSQTNVALNTIITSNTITVSGIEIATSISVIGGEYAIDGGPFTSAAGTVSDGQSVTLRQTSSGDFATLSETVLNIGGVSGRFSVTTMALNLAPVVRLSALTNVIEVGQILNLRIGGGTEPFTLEFSSDALSAEIVGDFVEVIGLEPGLQLLTITDAADQSDEFTVSVQPSSTEIEPPVNLVPSLAAVDVNGNATGALLFGGITSSNGEQNFDRASFSVGEEIQILAVFEPESRQVGEEVGVVVAIIDRSEPNTIFLFTENSTLLVFDGSNIVFFDTVILEASNSVDVTRDLELILTEDVIGSYDIHVGYQILSTGELIYNLDPIILEVVE